MKLAVEYKDGASLSEHVDFESVRENLKGQFKSEVLSNSGSGNDAASLAGMALGALFVDKLIDGVVTSSVNSADVGKLEIQRAKAIVLRPLTVILCQLLWL